MTPTPANAFAIDASGNASDDTPGAPAVQQGMRALTPIEIGAVAGGPQEGNGPPA